MARGRSFALLHTHRSHNAAAKAHARNALRTRDAHDPHDIFDYAVDTFVRHVESTVDSAEGDASSVQVARCRWLLRRVTRLSSYASFERTRRWSMYLSKEPLRGRQLFWGQSIACCLQKRMTRLLLLFRCSFPNRPCSYRHTFRCPRSCFHSALCAEDADSSAI